MDYKEYVQTLVKKSRKALAAFERFDQQQVDAVVRAVAKVVWDNAESLARMAVDETRMGIYEDKVRKNQGKARILWSSLKDKKSVGIIRKDAAAGIVEVAKPMGVVGAVTPCTNPIVTPMCNAMFALKGRNSIIIAPHPRGRKCAGTVVGLFNEAIAGLGLSAPADLIQVIEEPNIELTTELMKAVDVVIATGGMGMVKSAYSSGKPAYGVGVGNVQCIIDRDADVKETVPKIVTGRIFDNGIICSGEQSIIMHEDVYAAVIAELKANGGLVVDDSKQVAAIREAVFPEGVMNKDLVGKSAKDVAESAGIAGLSGIKVSEDVRLIAVKPLGYGAADLLSKEKMCPVISLYTYKTFEEAVGIAKANLDVDGKGHTISLHSYSDENIEYAANEISVSRVLINQVCATMNGGSFFNGLAATTTLGCGSWGNNIISENLDYKHLINVSRIAYFLKDAKVPSDDEIWG